MAGTVRNRIQQISFKAIWCGTCWFRIIDNLKTEHFYQLSVQTQSDRQDTEFRKWMERKQKSVQEGKECKVFSRYEELTEADVTDESEQYDSDFVANISKYHQD